MTSRPAPPAPATTSGPLALPGRRRPATALTSLSCLALLAGCGGGEDGGVDLSSYLPAFAAPAPVLGSVLTGGWTGITVDTAADTELRLQRPEYLNTLATLEWLRGFIGDQTLTGQLNAMRSSGAAFAHEAGVTGKGQLIAISDESISSTHEVLAGKVTEFSNDPTGDDHGTAVASVAAGNLPGVFVGTAPDADILFGTFQSDKDLADLGREALRLEAVAWNNSWGYVDPGTSDTIFADEQTFRDFFVTSASGADYLDALKDYAAYGVVVFAMSNSESDRNAGLMDALPLFDHSLEAGWLAVVNGVPTFQNSSVQSVDLISSACWEAARWCLAADGTWNAANGPTDEYAFTTGTSFAAPQVSGALALLAEAFPTLSPHDLRVRLLASAEDDFFAPDATVELADGYFKGYSVIYGHGFLDIEAALRPIGGTAMTMAEGRTIETDTPVLRTGSAFGDAVEVSLAGTNVAVRDALAAAFVMPAEALTASARPAGQADTLLAKSLRGNLAAERMAEPTALRDPFAGFAGPVLGMKAPDGSASAAVLLSKGGDGSAGVTVSRVLTDGPTRLELGFQVARDNGQFTSLDANNAAMMTSVSLGVTQDLGGGAFLALSGEVGVTDLGGTTTFGETGSARYDAVKLTAGASDLFTPGDRLSVGVGLPIAIASGETVLDLPVVREGLSAFESVALDLAPEARQFDLELTYQAELGRGLEMKLSMVHAENYGNRAGVSDQAAVLGMSWKF